MVKLKNMEKENINTIFREILGNSARIKIIDFLMENHREAWNFMEIKKNCDVGYSTLKLEVPKILEFGLIKIKKKIGKSNLYQWNMDNEYAKALIKFDWKIATIYADEVCSK